LSGIQALLSVLDKFRVENRRNMFVIKETKSGAIFYIRFDRILYCDIDLSPLSIIAPTATFKDNMGKLVLEVI